MRVKMGGRVLWYCTMGSGYIDGVMYVKWVLYLQDLFRDGAW